MNTHADKTQENKSQAVSAADSQKQSGGESTFQFVDNRPEAIAQRKLQEMANNSRQAKQATQLQAMADNHSAEQQQTIQKKENNTGLPDNLKSVQRTRIKGKDTQNDKHTQKLEIILGKSNDNALKRYSKEIARDNHANAAHFLDLIQTELTERQLSSVEKHGQGANWANATAYIDGAEVSSFNDRANSDDVREDNEFEFAGGNEASSWGTEIGISSGDTEVSLLDEVESSMTKKRLKKAKREIFIRIASTNGACDGCKQRLLLLKKKIRLKLRKNQSHIPIKVSYWYTTAPGGANRQSIPTTYGWIGDLANMFQYYNHDV